MATVSSAVLGLGNVLMADDAFGPTVVQTLLAHWVIPEEVEVEDLGTPGLDLLPFLLGRRRIVLVDLVRGDGEAGQLRRYSLEDVLRYAPGVRVSPHDPGLKECLLALDFRGEPPDEFVLIGAVPGEVDYTVSLTPALEEAVPRACESIVEVLAEWGLPAQRRSQPLRPDLWWREGLPASPTP